MGACTIKSLLAALGAQESLAVLAFSSPFLSLVSLGLLSLDLFSRALLSHTRHSQHLGP